MTVSRESVVDQAFFPSRSKKSLLNKLRVIANITLNCKIAFLHCVVFLAHGMEVLVWKQEEAVAKYRPYLFAFLTTHDQR